MSIAINSSTTMYSIFANDVSPVNSGDTVSENSFVKALTLNSKLFWDPSQSSNTEISRLNIFFGEQLSCSETNATPTVSQPITAEQALEFFNTTVSPQYFVFDIKSESALTTQLGYYDESWVSLLPEKEQGEARHQWAYVLNTSIIRLAINNCVKDDGDVETCNNSGVIVMSRIHNKELPEHADYIKIMRSAVDQATKSLALRIQAGDTAENIQRTKDLLAKLQANLAEIE